VGSAGIVTRFVSFAGNVLRGGGVPGVALVMHTEAYLYYMPHREAHAQSGRRNAGVHKSKPNRRGKPGPRYSVGLPSTIVKQVERYAEMVDASMSKAIASLVRLGLENHANRKREFLKRLTENLAKDDPQEQDRLVDEFRTLILGR
jgi:hypothetical protein